MAASPSGGSPPADSPPVDSLEGADGVSYTRREVESYLPSGWLIAGEDDDGSEGWTGDWVGRWDAKEETWTLLIIDGADMEWRVTVDRSGVAEHGRYGALRQAIDDAFRGRLGRPTRGLGISRGLRGLFSR